MKKLKNNLIVGSPRVASAKWGFTLIELLVVISIISLLSSIVLSSVQDARNKAKATAFRQNVEELKKAIELYRLNNDEAVPIESYGYSIDSTGYEQTYTGNGNYEQDSYTTSAINPYLPAMPLPPDGYELRIYDFNHPMATGESAHVCDIASIGGKAYSIYLKPSSGSNPDPVYLNAFSDWFVEGDGRCAQF